MPFLIFPIENNSLYLKEIDIPLKFNLKRMENITDLFISLLNDCKTVDMAESEFKRMVAGDEQLKAAYSDWCSENGYSFRNGFTDYCREYLDTKNSVWETLTDYDE